MSTLKSCLNNAIPYPIKGVFKIADIFERINSLYNEGCRQGESTGWIALDSYYTVKPGQWTLVTGIPSHGKSEFVDALIVNLMISKQWPFAIYSPENQPLERHAAKLIEKIANEPFNKGYQSRITKDSLASTSNFLHDHVTFLLPDDDDSHSIDKILELAKVAVFRDGVKGLVIDPWTELDHSRPSGLTETEYISQSLTKVRRFARKYGVHIWLVAHPTKLQKTDKGTYPVPTPYDVSGSAHWRNKADNAISI